MAGQDQKFFKTICKKKICPLQFLIISFDGIFCKSDLKGPQHIIIYYNILYFVVHMLNKEKLSLFQYIVSNDSILERMILRKSHFFCSTYLI